MKNLPGLRNDLAARVAEIKTTIREDQPLNRPDAEFLIDLLESAATRMDELFWDLLAAEAFRAIALDEPSAN